MIKIGIVGYGNLSRGIEKAIAMLPEEFELAAVFTRRDPQTVKIASVGVPVCGFESLKDYEDKIDVMMLCGGSATDLPEQGPELLSRFNTVDSFDTHARIPEYLAKMDGVGKASSHLGVVSVGWDPGLFSLMRVYFESILPQGFTETFWGKGVSQGHSDAIRRVEGVLKGVQYTVPKPDALLAARNGTSHLTPRQKHERVCYVVARDGADKKKIEETIVSMPNYFSDYDTTVNFISDIEFERGHKAMPHGGFVLRNGTTSTGVNHLAEVSIKLDSNPEFTSSILLSFARAVYRLRAEGVKGAVTVLDIAPKYLSSMSYGSLVKTKL